MRAMTLTLHPAIDRVLDISTLIPGGTFDAQRILAVPAGKGVNTARSLSSLLNPRDTIAAAVWIGEDEAAWFKEWLRERHGIRTIVFPRNCHTRCAYTLMEQSGRETHLKEAMRAAQPKEERELERAWEKTVQRGDLVALCGSAPPKTSARALRTLFALARKRGAAAVIADTNGSALEIAGAAGVDGIKGNAKEIGEWLGLRGPLALSNAAHRAALQKSFARRGAPARILITLGAAGAALATAKRIVAAKPPQLAKSLHRAATGCGDAATAGWMWALRDGCTEEETLRRAISCGTAKLASLDPGCLDRKLVERLIRKVTVREL